MARGAIGNSWKPSSTRRKKKKTSIGLGHNSRPTNKHKKRCHKKYRGQGK